MNEKHWERKAPSLSSLRRQAQGLKRAIAKEERKVNLADEINKLAQDLRKLRESNRNL